MFVYRIQHKDSGIGPFSYRVQKPISNNIKSKLENGGYYPFLNNKPSPCNGPVCHIVNHKIAVVDKQGIVDWFNGHFGSLHYFDYVVAVYHVKKTEVVDKTFLKNRLLFRLKNNRDISFQLTNSVKKSKYHSINLGS